MQFALEFVLLGMAFVFRKHRISPIASLIYGMPFLSMTMIVFNKEILQEFFSIARSTIEYFSNVDLNPKMMWSCYKKSHVQKLSNQAPQNFKTVKTDISLDSIVKQVEKLVKEKTDHVQRNKSRLLNNPEKKNAFLSDMGQIVNICYCSCFLLWHFCTS